MAPPLNPEAAEYFSYRAMAIPEFVSNGYLHQPINPPFPTYYQRTTWYNPPHSPYFSWLTSLQSSTHRYADYHSDDDLIPAPPLPLQLKNHQQASTVLVEARPPPTAAAAEKYHEVLKKVNSLMENENVKSKVPAVKGIKSPNFVKRCLREGVQNNESQVKKAWVPKSVNGENLSGRKVERFYNKLKSNPRDDDDIEKIKREDTRTSLMIKNIPNKFTREMLMKILDEHCMMENRKLLEMDKSRAVVEEESNKLEEMEKSREVEEESEKLEEMEKPIEVDHEEENKKLEEEEEYREEEDDTWSAFDFLYLPMDFGSGWNKGYAFVNFTEPGAAWKFNVSYHDHKWDFLHSKKICKITYAKIQGKERLVQHFQNSTFACASHDLLPLYFIPCRDGAVKSEQCTVGRRILPSQFWERTQLQQPKLLK